MSKKLIQEFVKLALREAAVTTDAAASSGLALAEFNKMLMLYDPKYYTEKLTQFQPEEVAGELETVLSDPGGMKGFIEIKSLEGKGECYGAWMISASAAEKGFGPLLYDIAIASSPNHTLTPDRRTVSDQAANVWKYYLEKRKDVQKLPLDNIEDPKTPSKEDDCKVFDDWTHEELDYAYRSPNLPGGVKQLVNNHQNFMKKIVVTVKNAGGNEPNVQALEKQLGFAGEDLFRSKYN